MGNKFLLEGLVKEGERLGILRSQKRALIREYLQSKIIYYLYGLKKSQLLSFIGGTSLRLLRGLDRFSEDLDFDNLGLTFTEVKTLFEKVRRKLDKEGFLTEYEFKKTNHSGSGAIKFIDLLFQLQISSHLQEKLRVKIDYTVPKVKPPTEVLVLSRFGLVQSLVTNTEAFILSQKMQAILTRKDLQPRDFYDVVWFLSRGVKPSPLLYKDMKVKNGKELASSTLLKNI